MNSTLRNALRLWLLFSIANTLFVWTIQGRDNHAFNLENDYLLIINTYTADAPWSNDIIEPVREWMSAERNLAVFAEHLNMLFINDTIEFNKVTDHLLDKYSAKAPRSVLLLGNSTLLIKDKLRALWGDIPLIVCAEMDFSVLTTITSTGKQYRRRNACHSLHLQTIII